MACCWDRRVPSRMHAPAGVDVGARTCGLARHGQVVARVMEDTEEVVHWLTALATEVSCCGSNRDVGQVVARVMEDKEETVMPDKIPDFNLAMYNVPEQLKLRDLKTDRIGGLSRITGTVTRTSEVRPELMLASFQCSDCYVEQDMTEQQFKYTEPIVCKNVTCNNRKRWYLNIEKSKFADFQRVRVQENSNEIPPGSMPRSMVGCLCI